VCILFLFLFYFLLRIFDWQFYWIFQQSFPNMVRSRRPNFVAIWFIFRPVFSSSKENFLDYRRF
jgi:hypothetical protein